MAKKSDPVCDALNNDLNAVTANRLETLAETADIQIMARALLEHEARRIETKLGGEHPRARLLRSRLDGSLTQINELVEERERVQIRVPEVASDSALVNGRVVDPDGHGIAGLTVCLTDANSKPIRAAGELTTADTGYFAFVLSREQIKELNGEFREGVFLAAFDGQGDLLQRQPKPLALSEGARLVAELTISRTAVIPGEPAPQPVTVPDLIGKTEQDAMALLERASLVVGERTIVPIEDREKAGLVVAQDPKAGTAVGRGSAVDIQIGGSPTVETPRVVGLTEAKAKALLEQASLVVGKRTVEPIDDRDKVGLIVAQDPEAGTVVKPGSAVHIRVGELRNVEMPHVVGMTASEAGTKIKAAGLATGKVRRRVSEKPGVVMEQEPKAGEAVTPGEVVNLVVGRARRSSRKSD